LLDFIQAKGALVDREIVELIHMRDLIRFGKARDLRIDAGLSCVEVARALGVHKVTLYHWERGSHRPRGEAAVKYAAFLLDLESLPGAQRSP